jgi:hypothetical protein
MLSSIWLTVALADQRGPIREQAYPPKVHQDTLFFDSVLGESCGLQAGRKKPSSH